ncbi:MAG: flippase-like domain-containing protein [Lachnospiraceae bacterium]|nr:flippase-like domain-containing protein [Lachnospiraceae bacterium]
MEVKKRGLWALAALLLAVLTVRLIFKNSAELSPEELLRTLESASPVWLITAIFCMLGFIWFEGKAILVILEGIGSPRSNFRGLVYGASDIYFSAITPSASGGQPASAYFMIRDGISHATTTAVLLLNLVMYTLAIVSIALVCIIFRFPVFYRFSLFSKFLILIGFAALSGLAFMFILLLKKQRLIFGACRRIIRFLASHDWIRNSEKKIEKLNQAQDEYAYCVRLMSGHTAMLLKAYLYNLIQRLCQFVLIICVYMAIGGNTSNIADLFATQCCIILGSNCVPVPGAIGVADYLMLDGYTQMFDRTMAFNLEMIGRSLSFYICVLVSAVITLYAYLKIHTSGKRGLKS